MKSVYYANDSLLVDKLVLHDELCNLDIDFCKKKVRVILSPHLKTAMYNNERKCTSRSK